MTGDDAHFHEDHGGRGDDDDGDDNDDDEDDDDNSRSFVQSRQRKVNQS